MMKIFFPLFFLFFFCFLHPFFSKWMTMMIVLRKE